jgi:hypothetical protein
MRPGPVARLVGLVVGATLATGATGVARAADPPSAAPAPTEAQIEAAVKADATATATTTPGATAAVSGDAQNDEAPPPLPRKKGIVVESRIGALTFLGRFRQVAPTAPWFHVDAGYELFRWLLLFGEGELALTDTSVAQDPSKARAFPIFGFGAGGRVTLHVSERVALYGQGSLGMMKADVARNAFALLGYKDAESLGLYLGGRLGVEWYMVDRHLALGLGAGVRDAKGFAKTGPVSDTPLMLDVALALRYTF